MQFSLIISFLTFWVTSSEFIRLHINSFSKSLFNYRDTEYRISMKFGIQKKNFSLIIDTGSSDLWIPSTSCSTCNATNKYNCKEIPSCKLDNSSVILLNYADGPVLSHIAWDIIELNKEKILKNSSFLLVYKAKKSVSTVSGIMGLGQIKLAQNPNPPILYELVKYNLIRELKFSLFLTTHLRNGSKIIFGKHLEKYFTGDIVWTKIISDATYKINLHSMFLNREKVITKEKSVLIDAGSSCIIFSELIVKRFIKIFTKLGIQCSLEIEKFSPQFSLMTCNSQSTTNWPDLDFEINGKLLTLTPNDYLYTCKGDYVEDGFRSTSNTIEGNGPISCATKIEASRMGGDPIFGMTFIQRFYTIFDLTNSKIGFAKSINPNGIQFIRTNSNNTQFILVSAFVGGTFVAIFALGLKLFSKRNQLNHQNFVNES